MTFRVFWFPQADEELQQLLADPSDRTVISAAVERIDRSLAKHPTQFGESRGEDTYIAFERPLGVLYEVDRHNDTVVVVAVWRINRK
jgi:mRNA-degrading endonuclease RelE of RelBE toxin-antitoxin system